MNYPPEDSRHWPDDYPVWTEADIAPMIQTPAVSHTVCPHCEAKISTGRGGHVQADDCGVCVNCLSLLIATPTGWRIAGFDESSLWDADPRVQAIRQVWARPEQDG